MLKQKLIDEFSERVKVVEQNLRQDFYCPVILFILYEIEFDRLEIEQRQKFLKAQQAFKTAQEQKVDKRELEIFKDTG